MSVRKADREILTAPKFLRSSLGKKIRGIKCGELGENDEAKLQPRTSAEREIAKTSTEGRAAKNGRKRRRQNDFLKGHL